MLKKRVLVTGGAGFVGSHIVNEMIKRGSKVYVVDDFSTGRMINLKNFEKNPNIEIIKHDVIKPIDIKVDKIFHLACNASPPAYMRDPIHTIQTCFEGTHNMLKLAEKYNAKMVFTSTSEVYGDPKVHPQNEEYWGNVNCRGIRSCYDEGKRAAETLCFEYARKGVSIKTARLFNTYGPNMDPKDGRVVSNFIMQALRGKKLTIYGNGKQTRSFTYISDTVRGLLKLMDCNYKGPVNIGNPTEYSVRQLAEIIKRKINDVDIEYLPAAVDDPHVRKPDIRKAIKFLDWKPQVSLEEGLEETIKYFKKCLI